VVSYFTKTVSANIFAYVLANENVSLSHYSDYDNKPRWVTLHNTPLLA